MKSRTGKIFLHIFGSLCFLAVPVVFSPDFDLSFRLVEVGGFRRDLLAYIFLLGVFYAHYYYFIPKFFHAKEFVIYAIVTVLSFGLVAGVPLMVKGKAPLHLTEVNPPSRPDVTRRDGPPLIHAMERNVIRFVMVLSIALLLSTNSRLRRAEKDKLDAELSYLKAQINPHFLFNTLNSIYSLAITRSEHAPNAILKLSAMMRYVTTEAHNEKVPLQKEIEYVSNYVELQRIRLGQTVSIYYDVKGEPGMKEIAPLIMIPYVENAFKYGVNPEEECFIHIQITIERSRLIMFVKNKIVHVDQSDEYKSGHGMGNAAQRLKMGYPGKHTLSYGRFDKEYLVNLEIDL